MRTSTNDELEAEWEETTQRLHEAQEKGAELVDRYEDKLKTKDAEIASLKARKPPVKSGPCKRCKLYRIEIVIAETLLAFALWFDVAQSSDAETRLFLFLVCVVPALKLWIGGRLRSLVSRS